MPENPINMFKKPKQGYTSQNVQGYEQGAAQGIGNRAGARAYQDANGRTQYDYSGSFKPIQGAAGIQKSTEGLDFSPIDEATRGYRNPTQFKETYKPSVFKFSGLPGQYGAQAYEGRAKDIRRENAGQLTRAQEAVGVRRPDMLAKMAEDNDRSTNEQLAGINSEIGLREMEKNTDLAVQEQMANADEGYRGYQSRSDLEGKNADERFRNLGALGETGFKRIGTNLGAMESERNYEDAALDRLLQLFSNSAGINNNSAQIAAQNRATTLNFLGSLVGGAKTAASAGAA